MFHGEWESLKAIMKTDTIMCPKPLAVSIVYNIAQKCTDWTNKKYELFQIGRIANSNANFLITNYLAITESRHCWEQLGMQLAQ